VRVKENAVKESGAQEIYRQKSKKCNADCRMLKNEYVYLGFIDDYLAISHFH
jgi:hypothetical protein